ncbi:hypothetical protein DH2020_021869 [Rehmannia glutinosa]|uniref:Uncharacterized protein n=1 Tax=Rehmannia glutinosa TaxID=99300 RepID=A0ABR0WFE0_REHGL
MRRRDTSRNLEEALEGFSFRAPERVLHPNLRRVLPMSSGNDKVRHNIGEIVLQSRRFWHIMRCGGGLRWRALHTWIRDYDNLQWLALNLIYAQIGCALVGSLGPIYNGVLLFNLGISLFALVAIESSSQNLARTYAVLLFCSIFLDLSWNIPPEFYGAFGGFLVKLTLAMQIIGFSVRLSSSLLWIQMYRLGSSNIDNSGARDTDADLRNSFLNPATPIARIPSGCDDVVGGSIYDPAYYSSLFEKRQG